MVNDKLFQYHQGILHFGDKNRAPTKMMYFEATDV